MHIYLPFMVLAIYAVLEKLDGRLIEATGDLGASPWRIFLTIVLPLSMPGVVRRRPGGGPVLGKSPDLRPRQVFALRSAR